MNKSLFGSDIDVPPLLMLSLATMSLVFNLCFPQYSAFANTDRQEFVRKDGLKEDAIALNNIKIALAAKDNTKDNKVAIKEETYSELKLEPKPVKPVKRPVAKVAKQQTSAVMIGNSSNSSRWVTVTAYSSTVDQTDSTPFITASGSHVRDGIIATNLLAFGTKVKFPSMYGEKVFVVEDRMNKRFSDRADIWFETREQAKQFGVRKLEMIIIS